ncbi:hypothetical protein [Lactococcus lactis]|uniref:hypothetical protein n=1 Tax=Lactococcus lactis TaxID=1358 RepID=UPI0015C3EC7E|nr:hypothetical protein [Lactococcus lactis]MCT0076696.1 hypothetical protein [Lactococcus lactis subsp. lactis]QLF89397.1 hypothetical protein HPC60_01120 [Lactococcus lactis subsp. lactis]
MKNHKWRFYRFRRKHKGWYLTLSVGVLGLLASLLVFSGLRFFYPKGIEAKDSIPVTSHHTLAEKSQVVSRSTKKQEASKSSTAEVVASSKESPKTVTSTTAQNSSSETEETPTNTSQELESSPVTYTATVGAFTRTSNNSQSDAQASAQAAYDEQVAQEKALQQSATNLKASIERENSDTQVNIIQEGQ